MQSPLLTSRRMRPTLLALLLTTSTLVAGGVVAATPAAATLDEVTVEQWRSTEIELTSTGTYPSPLEVEVDAVFTSDSGTKITRPAFWDGASTWRVRFAPTEVGDWTMTTVSSEPGDTGLHGVTASVAATPYEGDLEIYQRGFLRATEGERHLEYADGTPFFYLGDTHWILPHERFDTSNAPGVESQFAYVVDKRVDQGFTVYQSEPIWQPHDEGVSDHDRDDEEDVANLSDGFDQTDLPGFANLDQKFAYIADAGLVHANAQITWALDPATYPDVYTDEYMAELGRYWVARYGAYPVIWTMAQEIDQNMYDAFTPQAMSKWYSAGAAVAANDDYGQVIMPHMENTSSAVASTSTWKDKPWHDAFGAQFQDLSVPAAKDFWQSSPHKPAILYEAAYEDFWTDARGARNAGWFAFQNGMYGYGYGVSGVWNDVYSAPGDPIDAGTDYQLPSNYQWWFDGANRDTADQLGHLGDFYTARDWWKYEPRFDDPTWGSLPSATYLSSIGSDSFIAFFGDDNLTVGNGTLAHLDPAAQYSASWFDPRTGDTASIGTIRATSAGRWEVPVKPTKDDWVLSLDRVSASLPDGNLAAGAVAVANSELPQHPAAHAVDADVTTSWRSCDECGAQAWLELQLHDPQPFNAVLAITDRGDTRPAHIEVWRDGTWKTVADFQAAVGEARAASFSRVESDRVRIVIDEDDAAGSIREVGVYLSPSSSADNLALNGTYSSSSQWDENQGPANAFDGRLDTNWQACNGCWSEQWLEVDFDRTEQFDSVTVAEWDNRTTAYRIEYWNNAQWRVAYRGTGGFGSQTPHLIEFSPVEGSKARIVFESGREHAPIVYELTVHNSRLTSLPVGNLAAGGVFTASSEADATQGAANAFDARPKTNWQACGGCWSGEWLAVDFGTDVTFDTLRLSEYGNRIRDYVVEYWSDGAWHEAHHGTGPFGDRQMAEVTFDSVTGSQARIRFLSGVGFSPIIYDLGYYLAATGPTVTVKDGADFTVGDGGIYDMVSYKLFDAEKIDKVTINATTKDLTDNKWSDINFVRPGTFGAVRGANTLVVYDIVGNTTTVSFTLT